MCTFFFFVKHLLLFAREFRRWITRYARFEWIGNRCSFLRANIKAECDIYAHPSELLEVKHSSPRFKEKSIMRGGESKTEMANSASPIAPRPWIVIYDGGDVLETVWIVQISLFLNHPSAGRIFLFSNCWKGQDLGAMATDTAVCECRPGNLDVIARRHLEKLLSVET